jgi:hypothetical protein
MAAKVTAYDRLIESLKNHRVIAPLLLIAVAVIATAEFTGALQQLSAFLIGFAPHTKPFSIQGDLIPEGGVNTPRNIRVTLYWETDDYPPEGFHAPVVVLVDPGSGRLSFDLNLDTVPPVDALLALPPRGRFIYNAGSLSRPISEEMWKNIPAEDIINLPPKNVADYPQSFAGVGIIIAFDDTNDNGIRDRDERIVGVCSDFAVTFVKGDMAKSINWLESNLRWDKTESLKKSSWLSRQGYSFVKVVPPPEPHRGFDELVPTEVQRVYIMLYNDPKKARWPNWT